jgi:hypothetical protein
MLEIVIKPSGTRLTVDEQQCTIGELKRLVAEGVEGQSVRLIYKGRILANDDAVVASTGMS